MDEQVFITPGQTFEIELPWSEVCMHMRVAGIRMRAELTTGEHPMVQLWKDGRRFSGPVTTGEAGLFGGYGAPFYGYGITDVRDHEHTPDVIWSIPDQVMGAVLVRGAQITECRCGHRLAYVPREA